jgi:hypothetical protein
MRCLSTAAAAIVLTVTSTATAQTLDRGLITALDRIGGNLLGNDRFDAVLVDPPDPVAPERLRIYLDPANPSAVEIVFTRSVDPPAPIDESPVASNPPEPVRAFFRATVGGPDGLKLEFDPATGEIVPCVMPGDLSGIAAAPPDSGNGAGALRPGLVYALAEVGTNLLGAGAFDAVLTTPPDPVAPQRLRFLVSKTAQIEFVLNNPPEPVMPLARIVFEGTELMVLYNSEAVGTRGLLLDDVDLSGILQ